jgi:hypothetical protein
MRVARARIITMLVVSAVGATVACSDSAKPLGTGDKVIDDTAGQDAYSPTPPPPPADGGGYEAGDGGYAPALSTCGGCSCDPTKNYCFSGGVMKAVMPFPNGVFGQPEGGPDASGPPPAPCPVLPAGTLGNGCVPLPAACAAAPTCDCLLDALQPSYKCYLVCTPSPGFLEVYCPGP